MKKLALISLLFLIFGAYAQSNIETELSNEYVAILNSDKFNQSRIDDIESIAISNNYSYLRDYIAGSYLFNHRNRLIHSKEGIYKKFLEPNLKNGFNNSIPLSVLLVNLYEPQFKKNLESILIQKTSNGVIWNNLNISAHYFYQGLTEKALEYLPSTYENKLGVVLSSIDKLEVVEILEESSTPFLKIQDKILSINNKELTNLDDISQELSLYKPGTTQTLVFQRNGEILKREFIVKEGFNYSLAPYSAFLLMSLDDWRGAEKIANDFKNYSFPIEFKNSPLFKKSLAMNEYVLCKIKLNPNNLNIDKRLKGLEYCKSAINNFHDGIYQNDLNFTMLEFSLHKYNSYWAIAYADINNLMAGTYLKDYIGLGLGIEQQKPNLLLARKYLDQSPFLLSNSEVIKSALIEIYKDGRHSFKNQYKNVSLQTIKSLEGVSESYSYEGYISRLYLARIYRYDEKHKNPYKAFQFAKKSYELDKEYLMPIKDLATYFYYGIGIDEDKVMAHKLLLELEREFNDNNQKEFILNYEEYSWALRVLSRNYYFGQGTKKDLEKFFYYAKNIFGKPGSEYIDKLIVATVIDAEVPVTDEYLTNLLFNKNAINFLEENNLYQYIIYKAYFDAKPFSNKAEDDCFYVSKDKNIKKNTLTQLVYGLCALDGKMEESLQGVNYKDYLLSLSQSGSSLATYAIAYGLENESSGTLEDYKEVRRYLKRAQEQLKKNSSRVLLDDIDWLTGTIAFDAPISDLNNDLIRINGVIKTEENFQLAANKRKQEKENKKLQELRAEQRRERRKNAGNVFGNILEFTFKAALVVGAAAVVGDALEGASPEDIEALTDSLMGGYETYTYDWDGFYDEYGNWTFRCRTIENGRFAEDYNCIGEIKDDDRWPTY